MKRWAWQLALGLLAGVTMILGLQALVDSEAPPPSFAAATDDPEPGAAKLSPGVLDQLAGSGTWLVYLAPAVAALPAAAAPVVAVAADGRLRLLRPPPRAEMPGERYLAAGLVLPGDDLDQLNAAARAALLDCCAELAAGRGLRPDQLVPVGMRATPEARAALTRWLR